MNSDTFATTRWTQVLAAQGESDAALADLCAAYYAPVQAYIARTSHDLGDPRDLTQEFFARVLAGAMLGGADRERVSRTVATDEEAREELRYLIEAVS